ncbi:MAG: VWA domain-containing protein [Deltaproteobacteria bacterium]|nr:VWA domain-containing protein [Deltaproteobacteria bacterium]
MIALLLALACQDGDYPAPVLGSTYRIDKDVPKPGGEVTIDVFTTEAECANAKIDEIAVCRPQIDRAAGEVRLSFDVRDPGNAQTLYQSVDKNSLSVSHNRNKQADFELFPHDPQVGGQLFVLLLDKTTTMHENGNARINKVYSALLRKSVIESFLPTGASKSGVVLVKFNTDVPVGLDGQAPRVLTKQADYERMIQDHLLAPSGGYTRLYNAVRWSTEDLLKMPEIANFVATRNAEPTIVILTDGFNNETSRDTCRDNVPRLQELVDGLREIRRSPGSFKPRVFTVGLGRPYRMGSKPEGIKAKDVTETSLCGKYGDYVIDRGLELEGIDHVSLDWIAEAGGGVSFTRDDSGGLAEVFKQAAAVRYRWYTVHYRVPDNFFHRQSFDARLIYGERAETTVKIHPSPFLDAPTGERVGADRWVTPRPLRDSVAVLLTILSTLVVAAFVGPASFNARRALFRRVRPRRPG